MDAITRMRCFIQVVDSSGFSAAAREMGRSKALVSKYVGELEDELGVRLLNRTTRQVSLTEVGEAYYKEAAEILQRIDDLQASVQSSHQEVRGRLRVSAPRAMGDDMLNKPMMQFLAEYPDIRLDLRLEDRFVDLVEEGFDPFYGLLAFPSAHQGVDGERDLGVIDRCGEIRDQARSRGNGPRRGVEAWR